MKHKDQYFETLADLFTEDLSIVEGKGADYAKEDDVFSNFRFAANAAGVTINQVFLVLYGIKIARLENLLAPGPNEPAPRNESVLDTIGDLRRYAAIHEAYFKLKDVSDPTFAYGGDPGDEQVPPVEEPEHEEPPVEISAGEKLLKFLGF
jgi:hypothetical protein